MVAYKPPMGFNTWNTFGDKINEQLIRETADALVETGLRDIGYQYLVIDDGWSEKQRGSDGCLQADRNKFPAGIKAVADYVHDRGLKFGIYSCVGTMTCAGYPGSYRHEYTDARTFADWGVDFLKYDYCYRSKSTFGGDLYRKMGAALKNTGRDILFSACSWGHDQTEDWIDTTGAHMWRATTDIKDSWEMVKELAMTAIRFDNINYMNCFTDLDMLTVGMNGQGFCARTGCTYEEYVTHFSFWALLGSPLMIGCDVRNMDEKTVSILKNREVIAVNQDRELNRPYLLRCSDGMSDSWDTPAFAKLLENGDVALGFFNFSDKKIWGRFVTMDMIGFDAELPIACTVRDLWSGEEFTPSNQTVQVDSLEPHTCKLYRVSVKL